MQTQSIVDLLTEKGYLDPSRAGELIAESSKEEKGVVQAVIDIGLFPEESHLYSVIAEDLGAPYLDLTNFDPPKELLSFMDGYSNCKAGGACAADER